MAFTPVRLESKTGEQVIVTTAVDENNLRFNGGYKTAEDQSGIEEALKGGLDNGKPIETDADGDSEAVESETEAPAEVKADAKKTDAKVSAPKTRSGATATDASGTDVGVAGTGTTTA